MMDSPQFLDGLGGSPLAEINLRPALELRLVRLVKAQGRRVQV